MLKFNIKKFRKKQFGVNCKTKEEAEVFINILKKYNIRFWNNGEDLNNNLKWDDCKTETTYLGTEDDNITYSFEEYVTYEKEIKVYNLKDFEFEPLKRPLYYKLINDINGTMLYEDVDGKPHINFTKDIYKSRWVGNEGIEEYYKTYGNNLYKKEIKEMEEYLSKA